MATVNDIHLRGTRASQPAASAANKGYLYCVTDEGNILERSDGSSWASYSNARQTKTIGMLIDGGGSVITTGVKGYVRVPVAVTLTGWTILALDGNSGAIVIDVWMDTYANFPPTNTDSITNAHEPTITASAAKAEDTNISDWSDVTIPAGSVLGFNVDSVATFTKVLLQITCTVDS